MSWVYKHYKNKTLISRSFKSIKILYGIKTQKIAKPVAEINTLESIPIMLAPISKFPAKAQYFIIAPKIITKPEVTAVNLIPILSRTIPAKISMNANTFKYP